MGKLSDTSKPRIHRMKQWYATVPRKKKRLLFVMAALFPLFMWLMVYMLIPIFSLVINSFTNAHMAYPDFKFVGLYQFKKMFGDSTFITALKNTVVAVLFIVPTTLVLSTLTASGLNSLSRRWRELYTFVYFVPSILSMTAICLVWRWLYNANYGLINAFLNLLGLPSQGFIQDSKQALISMCVIQVWAIFGYYAVIILANMRAIDSSLFEAADIDGANSVSKFIYITVPMLRNTFLFVMIMATTTAFMFFTPVQILTDGNGSPGTSTMVLLLYIMKKGISQSNVGYASAISLILLLTILFFSLVQWLLTRERKCKIPKTDCVSLKEGDENE